MNVFAAIKNFFNKNVEKLKIFLFDMILGKIDNENDENNEIKSSKIIMKNQIKKKNFNIDFQFNKNQKRKREEYEDVQIYFNKKNDYVFAKDQFEKKENYIEKVNYGIIDSSKIKTNQKTSCNVWLAILDDNLGLITNKKLNLAYFEHQNNSVNKKKKLKQFFFTNYSFF